MLVYGWFSAPDHAAETVDPDRPIGLDRGAEATNGRAAQEHRANVALGIDGRAAVEPLVEIEYEPLLQERDLLEPGPVKQIDELAAGQVRGMGLVAPRSIASWCPASSGRGSVRWSLITSVPPGRIRCTWRAAKASGSITWWTT